MNTLNISSAIGTGWDLAKKHGLLVAAILLIVSLLVNALSNLTGPSIDPADLQRIAERTAAGDTAALQQFAAQSTGGASTAVTLLGVVIDILLYVGLYNLALGLVSGRLSGVSFDTFKLPLSTYVKYFAVQIIVGLVGYLALLLCVVPFFFVAPRLAFAGLYVIDNPEAGIIEAIKASWGMTKGSLGSLIGLGFAFLGIILVGLLCCCVGVYFALAVTLFAIAAAYYQLRGNWA